MPDQQKPKKTIIRFINSNNAKSVLFWQGKIQTIEVGILVLPLKYLLTKILLS